MPHKAPAVVSVVEKLSSGAPLNFRREFCPWLGVGYVTGYALAKQGKLKLTKIGSKTVVMPVDAYACRDLIAAGEAA
jgi:hypothetical protein